MSHFFDFGLNGEYPMHRDFGVFENDEHRTHGLGHGYAFNRPPAEPRYVPVPEWYRKGTTRAQPAFNGAFTAPADRIFNSWRRNHSLRGSNFDTKGHERRFHGLFRPRKRTTGYTHVRFPWPRTDFHTQESSRLSTPEGWDEMHEERLNAGYGGYYKHWYGPETGCVEYMGHGPVNMRPSNRSGRGCWPIDDRRRWRQMPVDPYINQGEYELPKAVRLAGLGSHVPFRMEYDDGFDQDTCTMEDPISHTWKQFEAMGPPVTDPLEWGPTSFQNRVFESNSFTTHSPSQWVDSDSDTSSTVTHIDPNPPSSPTDGMNQSEYHQARPKLLRPPQDRKLAAVRAAWRKVRRERAKLRHETLLYQQTLNHFQSLLR